MVHTDKHYHNPVILQPLPFGTSITIDTMQTVEPLAMSEDCAHCLSGTYLKVVSYVSSDAAAYPY